MSGMPIGIYQPGHDDFLTGIQGTGCLESLAKIRRSTHRSNGIPIDGHSAIADDAMLGVHGHDHAPFNDEVYELSTHARSLIL
jgi:hypothetical protein